MDEINNPHDVYFRERFTRREIAADFLRWHLERLIALIEQIADRDTAPDSGACPIARYGA